MSDYMLTCNHNCDVGFYDDNLKASNYLSEFLTEVDRAKVRKNLNIPDEYNLSWGNIKGTIENQEDLIRCLDYKLDAINLAYTNSAHPEITTIKEALDYLLRKNLTINISAVGLRQYTVGEIVNLTIKWDYNSPITSLTFNDVSIPADVREKTITGITSTTTFTVEGTNEYNERVSASITASFKLGYYYACATSTPTAFTQASGNIINVTAGEDLYIYILTPVASVFEVNSFEGGFDLIDSKFNYNGKSYCLYKSVRPNLGTLTTKIK